MYIAKTLSGLEEVLAKELRQLQAGNIEILKRAVSFEGDKAMLYKANYLCRTALRILKPIAQFEVNDENKLYQNTLNIPWEKYIDLKKTFAIDSFVANSNITHSYYAALKTKDAIADYFVKKEGKRPSVETKKPDIQLNLHITNNFATISLDSSGDSLHKRGSKQFGGKAPINEVLAAGLIYLSGWDHKSTLLDPFCGSGTILMEAAMYAQNIPAGYYKNSFCFENWNDFDKTLWEDIKNKALSNIKEADIEIIGTDKSYESAKIAELNTKKARLHKDVHIVRKAFEDFDPPAEKGIIITNPPYGERIKTDDIIALYKMIGNQLKTKYAGWNACIISSDFKALRFIGLKPSEKYDVFNGKIPCKFVKFELYQGSRKRENKHKNNRTGKIQYAENKENRHSDFRR